MVETIYPGSGGRKRITVGHGETFSNKIIKVNPNSPGTILQIYGNNCKVKNVGFDGIHPGLENFVRVAVPSRNATATVENLYMGDGAVEGSKGGIYVNAGHMGAVTFRNIHVARISNNGLYATPPAQNGNPGITHVENSYFRNNNISNVRVGSKRGTSRVKDTVIYSPKAGTPGCNMNCSAPPGTVASRGIWAWHGRVRVQNCDILSQRQELATKAGTGASYERVNTRTGSSANHFIPDGVPTSAEQAASGGAAKSLADILNDGENEIAVVPR